MGIGTKSCKLGCRRSDATRVMHFGGILEQADRPSSAASSIDGQKAPQGRAYADHMQRAIMVSWYISAPGWRGSAEAPAWPGALAAAPVAEKTVDSVFGKIADAASVTLGRGFVQRAGRSASLMSLKADADRRTTYSLQDIGYHLIDLLVAAFVLVLLLVAARRPAMLPLRLQRARPLLRPACQTARR